MAASKRKTPKKSKPRPARPAASRPAPASVLPASKSFGEKQFGLLIGAWVLVLAGLLALPGYNLLLRPDNPFVKNVILPINNGNLFAHLPGPLLIVAGFAALILLFRLVPPVPEGASDIPVLPARLAFWFFMALGAYLRLENPHDPVGFFWDDHYTITSDIRHVIDFHQNYFLFPVGWREPFFPYLSVLLWTLFPQGTGLIIVLLADVIIDMTALWLFYLAGKEIGGRRMGLLVLAMASICKTMVMVCKFEYGNDTCVLASAAALLFFLRLLKKPDLKHFLEWGAALGAGAFAYVPFRPWMPVFLGAAWLWVYSHEKERKFDAFRVILGPGLLLAWAFLFLYKNSFLPEDSGLVRLIAGPGAILFGLALAASYGKVFMEERKKGFSKVFGWATGAILTALIMIPFYLHPHYSEHVSDISAFSPKFTAPGQGWAKVLDNCHFTVRLLFGQIEHVSRLPALGDPLFEFMVAACALLGMAYFIARPRWLPTFVVSLFFVATVAGVLSNGPHSFRYVICDLPLLLAGAWGVNRLWLAALQAFPGRWTNGAFALAVLLGLAWEGVQDHKLVWEWMGQEAQNTVVWNEARQLMPTYRTYVVNHDPGFYAACAMDILADGSELYQATANNTIDLGPEEKGKDLAILVGGGDKDAQTKIEDEFPGVVWQKKSNYLQPDSDNPYLWWVEIPFDKIPTDPKAYFHVRRVPDEAWTRRTYAYYGLARGMINYEDRTLRWNDDMPPPQYTDWNDSMRVEGDWNVTTPGDYTLGINTPDLMKLYLDGKEILHMAPGEGAKDKSTKINLSAGKHHVEMIFAFNIVHQVPRVTVTGPNQPLMALDEITAAQAGVSQAAAGAPGSR